MANVRTGGTNGVPGGVYERERKRSIFSLHNVGLTVLLVFVLFTAVPAVRAITGPGDFYLFPRDAVDWTGWLTGVGAIGTTVALFYAARQFQRDAAEQREARINRDLQARELANVVKLSITGVSPDEDMRSYSGINVMVKNAGNHAITDLQIKIPDVPARIQSAKRAVIPPYMSDDDPSFGREDPMWGSPDDLSTPTCAQRIWLCGDLEPESMLRLRVVFDDPQPGDDWTGWSQKSGIKGRVAAIFTDRDGHTWIRASEGRQSLQRLWPESFVGERHPKIRAPYCAAPTAERTTDPVPRRP